MMTPILARRSFHHGHHVPLSIGVDVANPTSNAAAIRFAISRTIPMGGGPRSLNAPADPWPLCVDKIKKTYPIKKSKTLKKRKKVIVV